MSGAPGTVVGIQSFIASLQGTMASLPAQIDSLAASGDFASVFAEIQAYFGATPASSPGPSGPGGVSAQLATFAPGGTGAAAAAAAQRYLGVPYLWGGTTPAGFDCSGFVQYVYGQLGVALPRTSEQQAGVGQAVASIADAQPGDLLFYPGSDGTASAPGHVGIYLGNNEMIDAPQTGQAVSIQPAGDPVAIRRVAPSTAPAVPGSGAAPASTTPVPAALAPLFLAAAAKYNVPAQLLTEVARVESNFNPAAQSASGAEGMMQIMPQTAAGIGVNPYDPAQAIDGAAQLLAGYLAHFGSVPLALAAYNAGAGAVEQYGGIPPYPQTQSYVQTIMQSVGGTP